VLFAHPAYRASRINRALASAVRDLPGVRFRDLLESYPDFFIDVAREQELLRGARLLVLQHPMYWYGAPAIFKQWIDEVLTRGFAYGSGGTALHGKDLLQVVSTGAPAEDYRREGVHRYALAELLRPFEQVARFCGMSYLRPLVVQGAHLMSREDIETHAGRYRRFLAGYPATRPAPVGLGELWEP
jgi:putative NADPH-quinone reductase